MRTTLVLAGLTIAFPFLASAASQDTVNAVHTDPLHNAVYLCGTTTGNLDGENAGASDGWVAKLDMFGSIEWIRQTGTSGSDEAVGLGVDGAGNVYVTGDTVGTPDLGGTNTYYVNAWLNKYDANGTLIYSRNVKTKGMTAGTGVAADDDGSVFLSGFTSGSLTNFGATTVNQGGNDAWFGKLDPNGNRVWLQQIGTPGNDFASSVARGPGGSLMVAGYTEGNLGAVNKGGRDYWLARYSTNGSLMWIQQAGTPQDDVATALTVDSAGNASLSGYTQGSLGSRKKGTHLDAWIARYNANGRRAWLRQLDSGHEDVSTAVAANRNVVDVIGDTSLGQKGHHAWVSKFATSGQLNLTKFFPGNEQRDFTDIDVDAAGNSYVAINTLAAIDNGDTDSDAILAKFDPSGNLVWQRRISGDAPRHLAKNLIPEPAVTYVVTPQSTDSTINNWLEPHIVFKNNAPSKNGQLVVFFPGSYATPQAYVQLLKTFAAAGYYVIGLNYPNSFDVIDLCDATSAQNPSCQAQVRQEVITSTDLSPLLAVTWGNCIVNRLIKLLAFLNAQHPNEGWGQWLDGTGSPVWSKMILSGHSQGGGHAAYLAKMVQVARVVMLCAPQDQTTPGVPSPWVTSPGPTPIDRFYGFGHYSDTFYSRYTVGWTAMGLNQFGGAINVDGSSRPFGNSHQLLTAVPPANGSYNGLKAHNSPAADIATPLQSDATPIYGASQVWQYLITAP